MSVGRTVAAPSPRKGDVLVVDLPEVGGRVQAGRRPVVVVQADRLSRSGTVVVCPMTSATPRDDLPRPHRVPVRAVESGLHRDGWVKADQPMTLPAALLEGPIGRLAPAAIERLDAALRFVLDL